MLQLREHRATCEHCDEGDHGGKPKTFQGERPSSNLRQAHESQQAEKAKHARDLKTRREERGRQDNNGDL